MQRWKISVSIKIKIIFIFRLDCHPIQLVVLVPVGHVLKEGNEIITIETMSTINLENNH